MTHRLNTNKSFMIGNGILAFGVIAVVVIFVMLSLRAQSKKQDHITFTEKYAFTLGRGFAGDSISVYVNDSLLSQQRIPTDQESFTLQITRFAKENAILIVDHATDRVSTFDLSDKGGYYVFTKDSDGVKLSGH